MFLGRLENRINTIDNFKLSILFIRFSSREWKSYSTELLAASISACFFKFSERTKLRRLRDTKNSWKYCSSGSKRMQNNELHSKKYHLNCGLLKIFAVHLFIVHLPESTKVRDFHLLNLEWTIPVDFCANFQGIPSTTRCGCRFAMRCNVTVRLKCSMNIPYVFDPWLWHEDRSSRTSTSKDIVDSMVTLFWSLLLCGWAVVIVSVDKRMFVAERWDEFDWIQRSGDIEYGYRCDFKRINNIIQDM